MNALTKAYIGLGSNLSREAALAEVRLAGEWIAETFRGARLTEPYFTPGEGARCAGMNYVNSMAEITTDLSEDELTALLKEYELRRGRRKDIPEVTIDADLVIYGDRIVRPADMARHYFTFGYNLLRSEPKAVGHP